MLILSMVGWMEERRAAFMPCCGGYLDENQAFYFSFENTCGTALKAMQ